MRRRKVVSYEFLRSDVLALGFGFLSIIFITKLYSIQVKKHGVLSAKAQEQYQNLSTIQAKRGNIYARDMQPLAASQKAYLLYFEPKVIKDKESVAKRLATLLADEKEEQQKLITHFTRLLNLNLFWVAAQHEILPETKSSIEKLNISGVGFEEEPIRFYPEKRLASHVLGYVAKNNSGDQQGYFGIEGYFNNALLGRPGRVIQEKDALGNPILVGKYRRNDPIDGTDIVLTIDRALQYMVEKKLEAGVKKYEADFGSIIVMDPLTGEILALANFPAYDPGNIGVYEEEEKDIYSDQPINFAVSEVYEPGSVIKALTVSAGIDKGAIKKDSTFNDAGPVEYSGYTVDNWDAKHHNIQTITQLLQKSNNVGSSWVAHQVGGVDLYKYFRSFGLGGKTGVELEGEDSGFLRNDKDLTAIDLATSGFGQGMSATPLQVLNAFNVIANEGILLKPRIVKQLRDNQRTVDLNPKPIKKVLSKETAKIVEGMLEDAASGGEAKYFVIKNYRIAGKTGTAQIPKDGKYDPKETNATFVGYLSGEKKVSILVKLNRPKTSPYASETAVPVWMEVANEIIKYYGIAPDRDAGL
jgi:cell division protein FtsI/penicillin-binding protein 2